MCLCVGMHDLYIHHVTNIGIVSVCFTQQKKTQNEVISCSLKSARLLDSVGTRVNVWLGCQLSSAYSMLEWSTYQGSSSKSGNSIGSILKNAFFSWSESAEHQW